MASQGTAVGVIVGAFRVVHHLMDVERSWLGRWFAGQQGVPVAGINERYVVEPEAPEDTSLADLRAAYIQR